MAATGDINNNFEKLKSELKAIKYTNLIKQEEAFEGYPFVFLPIFHHTLLVYSPSVASFIVEKGFDLFAKNDNKFIA